MENSLKHLSGVLKEKLSNLRGSILHEIAFIESALDDPEHYSLDSYPQELEVKVKEFLNITSELLKNADNGRILKEGIKTVIVPEANRSDLEKIDENVKEKINFVADAEGGLGGVRMKSIEFANTIARLNKAGILINEGGNRNEHDTTRDSKGIPGSKGQRKSDHNTCG